MNKRIKYVNEMEDYLYNHNYISENNNNIKQQELSIERASCIVQKHRTLTEEKDKEIERLSKEVDMWNRKYNEQIDIINELEKYLYNEYLEWKDSENQSLVDKAFEDKEIYDYLKELKEGK